MALGEERRALAGLGEHAVEPGLALAVDQRLEVPGGVEELRILEGCGRGGDGPRLPAPGAPPRA